VWPEELSRLGGRASERAGGLRTFASGKVLHLTTHSNCRPLVVVMHSLTLMAPSTVTWGHRALLMIKPLDTGRGTPPRWGGRT